MTFPVVGPVGATWDEFRPAMSDAWQQSTALANWGVQELMKADVVRTPEMQKLLPMPPIQLYALRKGSFGGWSQSAVAVLRAVEMKYRSTRYKRIWLGEVRLPNTRYPFPYPMHNASWKASFGTDNVPLVTVKLPLGQFVLRLRGGKEFRRQLTAFKQIVSGEAIQGELSLYRQRANGGDHRNGTEGRDSGGQRAKYRLMCKLVAWLPKEPLRQAAGVLFLTSNTDALLVALNAKNDRLWEIHADHVRRWDAEHKSQLQRWSDDSKMEVRRGAVPFASRREAATLKFNRRMTTACQQFAAQVVNYAKRFHFATIQWVEPPTRFLNAFRWGRLFQEISVRADATGIEVLGFPNQENDNGGQHGSDEAE